MTDENTPLREQVNRSGYAFILGVAATIRDSGARQKWQLDAAEVPWTTDRGSGFVDLTIKRHKAIGVIECKKVSNGDRLVFLLKTGQTESETRCRLDIYRPHADPMLGILAHHQLRYGTAECSMVTGSPESPYCVGEKGKGSANLNLDNVASELLDACEGLLGDWSIELPNDPTACIPIIITNAQLFTCTFDPAQIDLTSGDLPDDAIFKPAEFIRFRKAFRHGAGHATSSTKDTLGVVAEGERTVFVVDSRHLVQFLARFRQLYLPVADGQRLLVPAD